MKTVSRVIAGAFLVTGLVSAGPVTWNFSNIVFPDGTTVTGNFVFDASVSPITSAFTSLHMTTSGGTSVPATSNWFFDTSFVGSEQNASGTTGFLATDQNGGNLTGAHLISLFSTLGPLMTDAGGTITLNFKRSGTCLDSTCANVNEAFNHSESFTNGGAFTTAIPEPATVILSGSALLLTIALRKYVRRSTSPRS